MATMQDHLDSTTVRAETPDGTAAATLVGDSRVTISFAPGYYAHSTDARVADKLQRLGRLLWVARMREYYRFKSEQLGREVRGEGRPRTAAQAERREARDQIVATGSSGDGLVEISAVGLFRWSVTVRPGTVPTVPEADLCAAVSRAAEALISDHRWRLRLVWSGPGAARRLAADGTDR